MLEPAARERVIERAAKSRSTQESVGARISDRARTVPSYLLCPGPARNLDLHSLIYSAGLRESLSTHTGLRDSASRNVGRRDCSCRRERQYGRHIARRSALLLARRRSRRPARSALILQGLREVEREFSVLGELRSRMLSGGTGQSLSHPAFSVRPIDRRHKNDQQQLLHDGGERSRPPLRSIREVAT